MQLLTYEHATKSIPPSTHSIWRIPPPFPTNTVLTAPDVRRHHVQHFFSYFDQAAYHSVRDGYQFTAELRKVLESLPPGVARAACDMLRYPPALPVAGRKRGREEAAAAITACGNNCGAAVASDIEDDLPFTTQVGVKLAHTSVTR